MTARITAEADGKLGPGHAVILVEGARVAPDDIRFTVRRPGYREDSLGPSGWQAAEAVLTPDAAYVAGGTLTLHVGPEMVSHMEPGMNVALALVLPDGTVIDGQLAWPAIAGPIGGAGARRGRLVATRRTVAEAPSQRSGGALVGEVQDTKPAHRAAVATAGSAAVALDAAADEAHATEAPARDAAAAPSAVEPESAEAAAEAAEPDADPDPAAAEDSPEAGEELYLRRDELRATRDIPAQVDARRGPWGRRVAAVASIAVVLIAGTAVASYYLGRDQICGDTSIGPLVDGWGLCPPVVVAAVEEPEPPVPADGTANEGRGWNIDPLAWLGPYWNGSDEPVDRGSPEPELTVEDEPVEAATPPAPAPDQPAPIADTPATQRALAREYLDTNPSPEAAFARAEELFGQAQVEAAFLIYRYAAEGGHDIAAAEVAAMYDPQTYTPQTSPLPRPNPEQARIWYQRAVDGGNTPSLLPLARLLAAVDEIEDARAVLRLAEEAGLADAARLLEELQ